MKKISLLVLSFALAATPLLAQEKGDPTSRMRDALRAMALQVRNLQTERDEVVAKKEQLEGRVAELEGTVKAQVKRATEDKEALDSLQSRITEGEARQRQQAAEIDRWKESCRKATEQARVNGAERAALAEKAAILERTVADQRSRNIAMFNVGHEILKRYEGFGLGTAISAREPFIGATKVKLENLVQDYSDKLSSQRIKP